MTRGFNLFALPAAALVAFAAPALAHPEDGAKPDRVMVIHAEAGPHGDHQAGVNGGTREFHVMRRDGETPAIECAGERTEVSEEKDGRKTKFFLCSNDKLTSEQRAERLEQALERIQSNGNLSAEQKERVSGALRDAIGKMRETN
ncbi:MAG TPA: hypothetical protein VGB62_10655 [Allosphingosinicella sp.]|jgi:hypothetical protein